MVESGLCEKIIKVEKIAFNEMFQFYISLIRESLNKKDDVRGVSSSTQEIFNDYYVNKTEVSEEMKVLDLKGDFMNPEIMKKIAE
jgi:hypothetical protein